MRRAARMMAEAAAPAGGWDLVIRNGRVIDGTGAPARDADVAVAGGCIAAIGDLAGARAAREIDARGRVVAPGFIDVHTHDDGALIATPEMPAKVSQGVTTVIAGNCGVSLAPLDLAARGLDGPPPPLDLLGETELFRFPDFAGYLDALEAAPAAVNAAFLVGHSTLRLGAMTRLDRGADADEIAAMRKGLEAALEAGAVGLSSGLFYDPAKEAPTEEVIALAAGMTGVPGALYATHMRDEADQVVPALEEAFAIGRAAGVPVVISHHKVLGVENFGRTRETLPLIERAARAQAVGVDVYPYIASSTVLNADSVSQAARTLITWSRAHPEFAGRDLDEAAAALGCSRDEAIERLQPAGAVYFAMDEDDVRRVLSYPRAMIGSDGLPFDERPHPRLWGTFPRVLGHYAREVGLFPLEEAVHRMTGLSAATFGLKDRGTIAPGAAADLVLFDPEAVIDNATFEEPIRPAGGIETVIVNGTPVWQDGAPTGARPGRILRRSAEGVA